MTDTTDISALREQAETAKVCGGMFAISGEQALSLLDQLEAERQRADKAQADMQFECDAHIETAESWREWKLRAITAETEIAALKARLANPVVLGSSDVMSRNFAIKAIIAAGFTVKGE
ncbi:hypothetical protein CWS43_10070 [Rahnella sp. AA]|uniref:hypothetical protein n=1 Tax=Rahnella sp. AA TaxID=2057180 RepID=UPI000C334EA1|nr:hypothetical protein [Rahnella sp. AA]PKE31014.1 hypothetical protein CWS43_10070 [Rahnella sp. AA]